MTAPGYWMRETSGVLKPAVERYLRGESLLPSDIAVLRSYLRQWINSPVWDENPHGGAATLSSLRDLVDSLTSRKQIELWTERAVEMGLDPW